MYINTKQAACEVETLLSTSGNDVFTSRAVLELVASQADAEFWDPGSPGISLSGMATMYDIVAELSPSARSKLAM